MLCLFLLIFLKSRTSQINLDGFLVSVLATFCWWTLTSTDISDSLVISATDQRAFTSWSSQRGIFGSIVTVFAEMLNNLSGTQTVVAGLFKITSLGQIWILDDHPYSDVSVTADSMSVALRTTPVTVSISSGWNTILVVAFTTPTLLQQRDLNAMLQLWRTLVFQRTKWRVTLVPTITGTFLLKSVCGATILNEWHCYIDPCIAQLWQDDKYDKKCPPAPFTSRPK